MRGLALHRRFCSSGSSQTRTRSNKLQHRETHWPGKKSHGHPALWYSTFREPLCINSHHKAVWADSRRPPRFDIHQPPPPPQQHQQPQVVEDPPFGAFGDSFQKFKVLCEDGLLDQALDAIYGMHQHGTVPPIHVYMSILKACNRRKSLNHAKQVHAHLAQHRLDSNAILGDYLVITLAMCGGLEEAHRLFCQLSHRSVFSWTAMITAYTNCGKGQEALEMYQCMLKEGVDPDELTFVSLFKACGSISDLGKGKKLHADAQKNGYASCVYVGSALVSMYGKCGSIVDAEDAFRESLHHNIVSWNAMLSAYVEQGEEEKALQLYRQMQEGGIITNERTFVMAVQACCALAGKEVTGLEKRSTIVMSLEIGRALHGDAQRKGFVSQAFVCSSLVNLYGRCGCIMWAENVFGGLSRRDVAAWNAMLSAYVVEQGQGEKPLKLCKQMQEEGASPNERTFVIALHAGCLLAENEETIVMQGQMVKPMSLKIGEALHIDAQRKGFASNVFITNTLLRMYSKCGSIANAENVFNGSSQCNSVSYTLMLSGFVEQGQTEKALYLCRQMQEKGVILDDVALVGILQACSETRSLDVCRHIHFGTVFSIDDPSLFLANTLLHAYGKCASMVDAQAVFDILAKPDLVSWNTLIAGYSQEGNFMASIQAFEELQLSGIRPDKVTFLALLFACRHGGFVDEATEQFGTMSNDHCLTPEIQHYVSMVDLLGRAGDFKRVKNSLGRLPLQPDLATWLSLLGTCQMHRNVELGEQAFHNAIHLQPKDGAAYVLMSNIYADVGL